MRNYNARLSRLESKLLNWRTSLPPGYTPDEVLATFGRLLADLGRQLGRRPTRAEFNQFLRGITGNGPCEDNNEEFRDPTEET